MANSKKSRDHSDNFARVLKFVYESEEENLDEIKESLSVYGIDSDELLSEGVSYIRSLEKGEKIKIAQEKRRRLEKIIHGLQTIDPVQSINEIRRRISGILEGKGGSQTAFAFFRKYESLSDEDLRNLLADAEFLNALEEELNASDIPSDEE